jgi:PPM family protein phosphatase
MRIEVGAATDVGRVRKQNEDAYLVDPPLYVVADGMGGARGGAVASQLAIESLGQAFHKEHESLGRQVRDANEIVFERSVEDRSVAGMGTTLTAVAFDGDQALIAHVGDSRAYLLRAGDLRQITEDHTLVNRMLKAGEISAQEAEVHPHRNVLTRALGTEPTVKVDEFTIGLLDGDRIVVCSDGLTGMVTEDQMKAILESTPGPTEAADRLVRAANRAGGIDNITVLVLDVHDDEEGGGDTSPGGGATGGMLRNAAPSGTALRRWGLRAGAVVLAAVVALVGLRLFLDRQWYVGVAGDRVAVFQGIPAEVLGFQLHHAAEVTDLRADQVEQLGLYAGLRRGITQGDRDAAFQLIERMRSDINTLTAGGAKEGGG